MDIARGVSIFILAVACNCALLVQAAAANQGGRQDSLESPRRQSYSVYFNGNLQGSIIRVPFNPLQNSYQESRGLTFEAWIKPIRSDNYGTILNKAVGLCKDDWVLSQTPSLGIEFRLANSCTGNNRFVEQRNVLTLGRWHHVAGVWDGDSIRLFLDGRQLLRSRYDGAPSANEIDMSIGANNHWDGNHVSFKGYIDEVRFSNAPRYISDFVPALRFGSDEHTVLLFHFDEGTGKVLFDSSTSRLRAYGESITWGEDVREAAKVSRIEPVAMDNGSSGISAWLLLPEVWTVAVLLGVGLGGYFISKFWKGVPASTTGVEPKTQGETDGGKVIIELFGGFHIRRIGGEDLSDQLSDRSRELFLIILLHTAGNNGRAIGIQTGKLTAALWPELDLHAAKNARGVGIKRLREILSSIGDIRILQHESVWQIEFGEGVQCDFIDFTQGFVSGTAARDLRSMEKVEHLLDLIGKGRFLPDLDYAWLDPIRADLENMVVDMLARTLDDLGNIMPESLVVKLSDAGLAYEPVNERFLCWKLRALTALGRLTAAQTAFARFAAEYYEIVGSPFARTFKECIS